MAAFLHRVLVNERHRTEPGSLRSSETETIVLCTTAQIVGTLSCFYNVKLDVKDWVFYYFFLNAVYYVLQSVFRDDAYPVRMCKYASNAALGVAIAPLVRVGWARLFGLPVPAAI